MVPSFWTLGSLACTVLVVASMSKIYNRPTVKYMYCTVQYVTIYIRDRRFLQI